MSTFKMLLSHEWLVTSCHWVSSHLICIHVLNLHGKCLSLKKTSHTINVFTYYLTFHLNCPKATCAYRATLTMFCYYHKSYVSTECYRWTTTDAYYCIDIYTSLCVLCIAVCKEIHDIKGYSHYEGKGITHSLWMQLTLSTPESQGLLCSQSLSIGYWPSLTAPAHRGEVVPLSNADIFTLSEEGAFILCDKKPDQADVLMD